MVGGDRELPRACTAPPRATIDQWSWHCAQPAELQRYLESRRDRWPIETALLGGARVADEHGAPPQRERGPEYIVVLVSEAYDGMPWLERVYHAGALWDGLEMGAGADVHCYTPAEFERKRDTLAGP